MRTAQPHECCTTSLPRDGCPRRLSENPENGVEVASAELPNDENGSAAAYRHRVDAGIRGGGATFTQGVWLTEDGDGAVEIFDCRRLLLRPHRLQQSSLRPDGSAVSTTATPTRPLRNRPVCG